MYDCILVQSDPKEIGKFGTDVRAYDKQNLHTGNMSLSKEAVKTGVVPKSEYIVRKRCRHEWRFQADDDRDGDFDHVTSNIVPTHGDMPTPAGFTVSVRRTPDG